MAETTEDMTRTGEALYQWYQVLFGNKPIADFQDNLDALRGLSKMRDTDDNRDELLVAASHIGLPEVTVNALNEWVNADRVKSDHFPEDKGFFSKDIRELMATDLNVFESED